MALSVLQIWNMALGAAGIGKRVESEVEQSFESKTCNLWYPPVRDMVLRTAPWTCVRKARRLAVRATRDANVEWANDDPLPDYKFAYSLPEDFIYPQYLSDFSAFILAFRDGRHELMTNTEKAILIYSHKQMATEFWDASLSMAVVYALAAHLVEPFSGKNQKKRDNFDLAQRLVWQAQLQAANEDSVIYDSMPDWLVARGVSIDTITRFYYPTQPLLMLNQ